MLKKLVVAAMPVLMAAAVGGSNIAAAQPGPTPDQGLTGACNMTNTNASYGMFTIAGNTPAVNNGFTGMIGAIIHSFSGAFEYQYCPPPQ